MKKSDLVKAAKEVNTIIEPPIDTKMGADEIEAELLEASEAISEEDGLSKATMNILNEIKGKYNEDTDEDDEDEEEENGETEETDDEDPDDEDPDVEGEDEEDEDGEQVLEDEESIADEEDEEEDEPAPKKPVKAEKPVKADKPKKDTSKRDSTFKGNKTVDRIEYFVELINEGRYTKKDLVELATKKFPDATISALSTILSDGGNIKYCRFPVLIKIDKEDGNIVKFTDQIAERGYPITTKVVMLEDRQVPKKKEVVEKEPVEETKKAGKKTGGKKK